MVFRHDFAEFTALVSRSRFVSACIGASAALVLGGWFWAFFALKNIDQPLIIHFTNQLGITGIGGLGDIAQLGILGLVIVLVDGLLAFPLDARNIFLGKLLAAGTLLASALIFIAFWAIISVN